MKGKEGGGGRKVRSDVAGMTWGPSHIVLTEWVDWDKNMLTMMDSGNALRMLADILHGLPTHRSALIDEEATLSASSDRVHHMKIMMRIKSGSAQDDWVAR